MEAKDPRFHTVMLHDGPFFDGVSTGSNPFPHIQTHIFESTMTESTLQLQQSQPVQQQQQEQLLLDAHVQQFPLQVQLPVTVGPIKETLETKTQKPIRTSTELIQFRLLEAGAWETPQTIHSVVQATDRLVSNLQSSGCVRHGQVHILPGDTMNTHKLHVALDERNWYKLYIGGGIKQDGSLLTASTLSLPKLQFETKGSLLNRQGVLDTTTMEYCVDQSSTTSLRLLHDQPLYSLFPKHSKIHQQVLQTSSELNAKLRAEVDTMDHEWTRSYQEFQRSIGATISTTKPAARPEMSPNGYLGIDWSMTWRDLVPRRNNDCTMNASPEIIQQSGPSVKHSFVLESRTNGAWCNDPYHPTKGLDVHAKMEVAGPPGDVGFVKVEGGASIHYPITNWLSIHAIGNGGCLSPLLFGGLCAGPTVLDKFFVGGPHSFRGFVPAGIGPRAKTGGTSTPNGDALGGDLCYTMTLAASTPLPYDYFSPTPSGIRVFGFATAGTVTGLTVPLTTIVESTRLSVGAGVSMKTGMGKLEATYAIPIWYGPRDARQALQFGVGFHSG